MDCTRNKIKEITDYIKNLGVDVNFNTKARGHQGFFLKKRIDISNSVPKNKVLQILLHEFSHYVVSLNYSETPDLSEIFHSSEDLGDELWLVTNFVDENSKFKILTKHKLKVKSKIAELEKVIKSDFPKFQRSKRFREFDKYIRFSKAKYLLKYDRVKYITPFLRRTEYYSVDNLEKDFDMPKAFSSYIRLRSYQRKQARISKRINKLKKYYSIPSELFARFIEGLYIDKEHIKTIAPKSFNAFERVLNQGYYIELYDVLTLALK